MEKALNKANGHIVQADWNEQDSSSFSYICNKPDLSNLGMSEEEITALIQEQIPEVLEEKLEGATTGAVLGKKINGEELEAIGFTTDPNLGPNRLAMYNNDGQLRSRKTSLAAKYPNYIASKILSAASDKTQVLTINDAITLLNNFDINIDGIKNTIRNTPQGDAKGLGVYVHGDHLDYESAYDVAKVRNTPYYDEHFVLSYTNGEIPTVLTPTYDLSAASKGYVDAKTERIKVKTKSTNSASTLYSSSIRFGDLYWEYLFTSGYEQDAGLGGDLLVTFPELPGDENTEYTITVANVPEKAYDDEWPVYPRACAVPSVSETFFDYSSGEGANDLYNPSSRLFVWTWKYEKQEDGSNRYYDASTTLDPVYQTGDWKIVVGSAYMGDDYGDLDLLKNLYKDITITYTCRLSEDGPSGPVHSIELHSDTEVHYDYKVTELTINNLVRCFPADTAQQWVVSFFAGDDSPIVTLPNNMSITSIGVRGEVDTEATTLPLKWFGGIPTFAANKHYMLTFKEMIGSIYAECIELPDVHQ